jgi:glycosyltransferase involved in cell wall biosynthesis
LKILHLNYFENEGGAAIAVKRIHHSLMSKGINSNILVAIKESSDSRVIGPESTFEHIFSLLKISFQRRINKMNSRRDNFSRSFNLLSSNILRKIKIFNPDIVHLHWIGNEMLSIKQISMIEKPIVWTLHDMWPYCGSEHYTFSNRYIHGYSDILHKSFLSFDLDKYIWKLKKKYLKDNIFFIPTSEWQEKKIKESYLYKNYPSELIHLPLNFNFWKPIDKKISRQILNIPNKKIIIFGGDQIIQRKWKGFDIIKKIFNNKDNRLSSDNFFFLVFGKDKDILTELNSLNIKYKYFDNVAPDSYDLKLIYSAADLFLMPSLIESFGQMALEACSCGTPTVCFANTGVTDVVQHLKTGFVANHGSDDDFLRGIIWCLDSNNTEDLKNNCVKFALKKFSPDLIAEKYINVYQSIIKK